jgi:hypothetical protein
MLAAVGGVFDSDPMPPPVAEHPEEEIDALSGALRDEDLLRFRNDPARSTKVIGERFPE